MSRYGTMRQSSHSHSLAEGVRAAGHTRQIDIEAYMISTRLCIHMYRVGRAGSSGSPITEIPEMMCSTDGIFSIEKDAITSGGICPPIADIAWRTYIHILTDRIAKSSAIIDV
jgi:hypothetical protein